MLALLLRLETSLLTNQCFSMLYLFMSFPSCYQVVGDKSFFASVLLYNTRRLLRSYVVLEVALFQPVIDPNLCEW